jgi:hypothetical protein
MEQRPGLRSVAARWPQLSPVQTRWLYDLVYRRAPEHLSLPVPPAGPTPIGRGVSWSPLACGFPLLWAVRAEQRYARWSAASREPAAQAALC